MTQSESPVALRIRAPSSEGVDAVLLLLTQHSGQLQAHAGLLRSLGPIHAARRTAVGHKAQLVEATSSSCKPGLLLLLLSCLLLSGLLLLHQGNDGLRALGRGNVHHHLLFLGAEHGHELRADVWKRSQISGITLED